MLTPRSRQAPCASYRNRTYQAEATGLQPISCPSTRCVMGAPQCHLSRSIRTRPHHSFIHIHFSKNHNTKWDSRNRTCKQRVDVDVKPRIFTIKLYPVVDIRSTRSVRQVAVEENISGRFCPVQSLLRSRSIHVRVANTFI